MGASRIGYAVEHASRCRQLAESKLDFGDRCDDVNHNDRSAPVYAPRLQEIRIVF